MSNLRWRTGLVNVAELIQNDRVGNVLDSGPVPENVPVNRAQKGDKFCLERISVLRYNKKKPCCTPHKHLVNNRWQGQ